MLACPSRLRRPAAVFFFNISPARSTSTTSNSAAPSTSQPPADTDSIFTAPESPWEHVFSDLDPVLPQPSAQTPRTRSSNAASRPGDKERHGQHEPFLQRKSGVRQQRASITAREMKVFDEMFDMIFNAVSSKEGKASSASTPTSGPPVVPHAPSPSTPSIGSAGAPLNDLFRTLRRHTSRVRWTTAIDEELDRKKETMELFNTDHQLLQWVTMELFGEWQWDEAATRVITASGHAAGSGSGSGSGCTSQRPINHTIYPHLIAHAMRIFRTTYSNPSLSLAIFNHAARVSIPSYVFGCTAPAYNELIEARWEGWGDLEGVCSALEEMKTNGVKIDGRTRIVVEKVRRMVGEARPNEEELGKVNALARRAWTTLGEEEVMRLVHRIEELALRDRTRTRTRTRSRKPRTSPHEEAWKKAALEPIGSDGWSFDGWDKVT